MYTKEQLEGILLTIARPEVTIYNCSRSKTGHTIRLRIMFRANRKFLINLQRKFEQLEVESVLRETEGQNRQAPVLIVGKKKSLEIVRSLLPNNLPCSHANWERFDTLSYAISNKEHLEDEGMKRLIEMIDNDKKQNE